jgi:RimJ/RimL family protein N-acetyltransferase
MAGASRLTGGAPGEVHIRDVGVGDVEIFYAFESDPEAMSRAAFPARDRETFMAHWANTVLPDPSVFTQTVVADGEVAGSIVCWDEGGQHWLGYWLGRDFWGRGIGTRALRLFLDREKRRPLVADPFVGNTPSVALLEKVGFQRASAPSVPDGRPGAHAEGGIEHIVLVLP